MISLQAAKFILDGHEGNYSDVDANISITKTSSETHLDLIIGYNCISGYLLEAYFDDFGDLSLIFPESDIKLPVEAMA